jgi:hypothetical protein
MNIELLNYYKLYSSDLQLTPIINRKIYNLDYQINTINYFKTILNFNSSTDKQILEYLLYKNRLISNNTNNIEFITEFQNIINNNYLFQNNDYYKTYNTMGTLNELITIVAIHLKSNKPIQELIDKYGEEMVADAMQFVMYNKRETIEIEEDYEHL